ncbi:putative disease resistance RPP13-like protein 1 [Vitis vinifera]|uniref:Putative disease resistance RPP13-like protein 1 n=1 Tax=Vitis vinifera TaxID=29760 RepID=A0A438DZJ7_VITVI|nr:putative disease resistance RPP13-like protein 1 [Vitis vinifera]
MEVVGNALLSDVLGSLSDKLGSYDFIEFASEEKVDTELKKWEKELQSIWQELNDAEEKQITVDTVKSWVFDLRVLAYDMEDILDEFDYELMRRKPMGAEAEAASTSKKRKFFTNFSTSFNPAHVVFSVKMGSKIREITSRLQDISARKAGLGLEKVTVAAATSAWQRPPPTTPIAYEPRVYGRDEDKTLVLDLLRKVEPNENNVSVISIVGLGGVGQDDSRTAAILNSVLESDASGSLDFQQVQKKLTDTVGSKGSKVIVTTRNKNVTLMMGAAKNVHKLNPLSEDACWSVFEKHAFEHRDINDHPNLVSIGRKIVGKCGGLPLAAKALGSLLRSKQSEAEWETRCFAYCAMFPKNWKFESQGLVLLWMAEGLIQQPKGCLNLDEMPQQIGVEAFVTSPREDFISRLENVVNIQDPIDANLRTKLNVEELIMSWSSWFDNLRNEDTEMEVLLSLQPHTSLKKLDIEAYGGRQFPNWICDPSYSKLVELSIWGCMRCTDLPSVGQLPFLKKLVIERMDRVKSVGLEFEGQVSPYAKPFQCLEYLSFREMKEWKKWSWSRESFSRLVQLQIKYCPRLRLFKLEQKFLRSLPRLQLLEIDDSGVLDCLWENGLGLENLAKLRVLDCNQLVSLGEEEAQGLPCNLQYLEIRKCDNLEKLPHGLYSYASLTELIIVDCAKLVSFPDKGFPLMLRRLTIANCKSLSSLPDSSNCSNMVCVLEYLNIYECPSLICFPIGQLPTTLKELHVSSCENLKSLPEDIEFSALEHVKIWRCSSFIGLPKGKLPPTLKKLTIYGCEKLESLPEGIMHHHSNNTTNCGLQFLHISECSSLTSFPRGRFLPTLKSINIYYCAQLQPISEEMFHRNNNALEVLSIWDIPISKLYQIASTTSNIFRSKNTPLSEWGLARLTSLKTLTISDYHHHHHHHPLLLPTTLLNLRISRFENLESLAFLSLQRLTSLKTLNISRCPKLQSFLPREGLSETLSELFIEDCPLLSQSKMNVEAIPPYPLLMCHNPLLRRCDKYGDLAISSSLPCTC